MRFGNAISCETPFSRFVIALTFHSLCNKQKTFGPDIKKTEQRVRHTPFTLLIL